MCRKFSFLAVIIILTGSTFFLSTYQERPKDEHPKLRKQGRSGALEALDFWTQSRAYPDNDIPMDKYYKAFQTSKSKTREVSGVLSAGSIWDPIGPLNLQGRTRAVAINPVNPNTVFVGTASGGLWRSYTGGLTGDWEQVKLGHPALGVSAIVIDPADTNVMYLGTGEVYRYVGAYGGLVLRTTRGSYGIGILKTTDGGRTWTKSLDWSYNQQTGIQSMKMNPLNSRTIWAATTEGIYKTTNAGATWDIKYGTFMAMDLAIHLTDTNSALCTVGNFTSSVTLRTTDGGENWDLSPIPSYTGKTILAVYEAHPNVVYASAADSTTGVGALYRSTDFGLSWTQLCNSSRNNIFGVQGWYSHYVAVHPTDSSIIVHNSVGRSKSVDGGRNFVGVSSGYSDNHGYAIHPTNRNIFYAANDDGIYRSTNFGSSYTNIGFGMQTGQIYNGFACSTTDSMVALAQSQDHIPGYRYLGSSTWDHGSAVDEAGWCAINPANDNVMYAVYRFGYYVYKSVDRGESFFWTGSFTSGAWNSPIVVYPSNPDILYFATTKVYKSTNSATNWSATNSNNVLDGNPALALGVSSTSPDTAYVGMAPIVTTAHLFRTTNGGSSWTNVTGTLPNRYPIDLAVDPSNSRTVYVAFGGFGTGHVYKTTDAGGSWSDVSGSLPDAPATALVIDPLHPNVVYAGNDIGVYVSTNGGGSWSAFSAGLPDAVIVADLAISNSNRTLRVATHGNGIWERKMLYELSVDYFDYKATTINSPVDGAQYNLGTSIPTIRASFRNLSAQARIDSFNVQFRILRGETEEYSSVKRIPGLGLAETRSVAFDGSFTPPDTADYTLQAITLASDNNASNDTLTGSLSIVSAPTIQNFIVTKIFSPYSEITGGSSGPSGDDFHVRAPISFGFTYDNHTYDSVQISTNGWIEFGSGPRGMLRGLSTDGQLGGYFKPALPTTDRPSKAIGPWWTDLSANGSDQLISYKTEGSSPDRVFVVQWKNVPANFDVGTTTYINFQIKLYETSNVIDFSYGPMVAGSMPAGAQGASIGLKDYIGGDNRYYDVMTYSVRSGGEIVDYLNPLTDWPGADSTYRITTNTQGTNVALQPGWNMVSLPMNRADRSVRSVFPTSISGTSFKYMGSYQSVDSLSPGAGYWLKTSSGGNQFVDGTALASISVQIQAGWNMIGSVDHPAAAPSGGIVTSSVFVFTDSGYAAVSTLSPGKGFWLKASSDGMIGIGPHAEPAVSSKITSADVSLTIFNKFGKKQSLYLTETEENVDTQKYELPPLPPGDVFDARFASQRMTETYSGETAEAVYPVQMQSPVYPLTIAYRVDKKTNRGFVIDEISNGHIVKTHTIYGEGKVVIASGDERSLRVRVAGSGTMPAKFALMQNYPNPFNPATAISFDLPAKSRVLLTVYDIVGREVMTLADAEYEAGSHTLRADLSSLATGIYVYRLNAGDFSDIKKMVLMK